mmetsp:Transcript_7192/g.21938  ORF Transcript_7192/g.21938 Transcript_7192/m.21938 type:complete len:661 (-) Transcript_7192:113-2095(-)|eukprot:CAMPEP_0198735190 /NCGR_PEP_ID=MMETSP1475-20131203/57802_1 /TAXON_ID= ORGANISM="Unidentified sp., Strain CCMP1999" /NCGR_SAMPLE_ID=MMETSP1475 /ASSEMBLY_ACC=CAM_ASM_001111 /LENGTH=660 /DNA_ID=CAMNT_0044498801 /DNA_START=239 /DNA_END=2221 /DNA_ORIENTATION=+
MRVTVPPDEDHVQQKRDAEQRQAEMIVVRGDDVEEEEKGGRYVLAVQDGHLKKFHGTDDDNSRFQYGNEPTEPVVEIVRVEDHGTWSQESIRQTKNLLRTVHHEKSFHSRGRPTESLELDQPGMDVSVQPSAVSDKSSSPLVKAGHHDHNNSDVRSSSRIIAVTQHEEEPVVVMEDSPTRKNNTGQMRSFPNDSLRSREQRGSEVTVALDTCDTRNNTSRVIENEGDGIMDKMVKPFLVNSTNESTTEGPNRWTDDAGRGVEYPATAKRPGSIAVGPSDESRGGVSLRSDADEALSGHLPSSSNPETIPVDTPPEKAIASKSRSRFSTTIMDDSELRDGTEDQGNAQNSRVDMESQAEGLRKRKFTPNVSSNRGRRRSMKPTRLDPTNISQYLQEEEPESPVNESVHPVASSPEDGEESAEVLEFGTRDPSRTLIMEPFDEERCIKRIRWCAEQGLGIMDLSHLHLRDTNLKGLISEIVRLCPDVWTLHLNFNFLTELPDEISNLTNLAVLTMRSNRVRRLPDALGECQALREVDAADNELSQLPKALTKLPLLTSVDMSKNLLASFLDATFAEFQLWSLSVVNLRQNKLKALARSLCLAPLTVLDLSNNEMLGLPNEFERLKSIRKFSITDNPCVPRIPRHLLRENNAFAILTHLAGRR